MKIRYFDLGLHRCEELNDMQTFLPTITDDYEIYGFEACPTHFKNYCSKYNEEKNTKVYNLAISNIHNSVIPLYMCPNKVGHSIFSSKFNVNKNVKWDVNSILFSEWIKDNNIDLDNSLNILKVNIEGAEMYLFNDLIKAKINNKIHIYCGTGNDIEKIEDFNEEKIKNYYQLLKDNNIHINTWVLANRSKLLIEVVDLHKIIKDYITSLNI